MPSTPEPAAVASDAWVLLLRPPKNVLDPRRPYAFLVEPERTAAGEVEDVATIFLTNRECPFRCVFCDLWKNTTDERVPAGAIPEQIRHALDRLPPARHIKLYNAGNFFDPNAIPPKDYPAIADLLAPFASVIVESHPRLIGRRCWEFRDLLAPRLHVAMGLETANPDVLAKLNKRMTLDDFRRAAGELLARDIAIRAFIMVRPPFTPESQALDDARRSLDFAFDAGVECCALIPARGGNGAVEDRATRNLFAPPTLAMLEAAFDHGLHLARGRVFADLWDIERLATCAHCAAARTARLRRLNLTQHPEPRTPCNHCQT